MRWVGLIIVVLGVPWTSSSSSIGGGDPETSGIHEVSRTKLTEAVTPGVSVRGGGQVPWRVDSRGRPVVSPAGLLEVVLESATLRHARTLDKRPGNVNHKRAGGGDTWGHVEALRATMRVARAWRSSRPKGPRLVIEDLSAAMGGFPDRDGNGQADHLTHQLGLNVDFLLPVKGREEGETLLGTKWGANYDAAGTQALVRLLIAERATSLTTSSLTRLLDAPGPLGIPFKLLVESKSEGTSHHRGPNGQSLRFLSGKSHGNIINVRFAPSW